MKCMIYFFFFNSHNMYQDTFWYTHSLHVFITTFVRMCFVMSLGFSIMYTDTMSRTKLHLD